LQKIIPTTPRCQQVRRRIFLQTRAGAMETFISHPERGGPHPAVFMLMDAPGIREELRDMARRLATCGYFVLLPNLYYRAGRDTSECGHSSPQTRRTGTRTLNPEHSSMQPARLELRCGKP